MWWDLPDSDNPAMILQLQMAQKGAFHLYTGVPSPLFLQHKERKYLSAVEKQ